MVFTGGYSWNGIGTSQLPASVVLSQPVWDVVNCAVEKGRLPGPLELQMHRYSNTCSVTTYVRLPFWVSCQLLQEGGEGRERKNVAYMQL